MGKNFACRVVFRVLTVALATVLFAGSGCSPLPSDGKGAGGVSEKEMYDVGFGYFGPEEACENAIAGYIEGLRQEGFEEGKNLRVHRAHASGQVGELAQTMRSLEAKGLDVLCPMSTPGLGAALGAVRNTPIVFVYSYDPLGAGAGKSFEDHLPNVTGVASLPPIADTMDYIIDTIPGVKTVGTLYNASESNSVKAVEVAREALDARDIALTEVTVTGTADVYPAAQALAARQPDAIWLTGDNTLLQAMDGALKPAADAGIPVILNDPEFVERGAIMGVGVGWGPSGVAAGKMAARVMRGESPADMPIVPLAEPRGVLNQAVADKLGITFSQPLLEEAADVIGGTP